MNLYPHIEEKTIVWTDDCQYNKLIIELGSDSKVVSTHKDYDRVNHLSTTSTAFMA